MEQERNDLLLDDLMEAKGCFDNLIQEMMDKEIVFSYEDIIKKEEASYTKCYNAISRMNGYIEEYNFLLDDNSEFFEEELRIYVKYTILYAASLIIIKLFSKTLSSHQLNEMWYGILGLLLGSVNVGIINKNVNNHRYGDENSRNLMNRLSTLKESYKEDYSIAYKEIENLFSINRNLWKKLDSKILTKEKSL